MDTARAQLGAAKGPVHKDQSGNSGQLHGTLQYYVALHQNCEEEK